MISSGCTLRQVGVADRKQIQMTNRTPFFRFALSISIAWLIAVTALAVFNSGVRNHLIFVGANNRCNHVLGGWAEQFACTQNLDVTYARLFLEGAWSVGLLWVILPVAVIMTMATFGGRYLKWLKNGR